MRIPTRALASLIVSLYPIAFAAQNSVTFRVTDPFGRAQSCSVKKFHPTFDPKVNYASRFRSCRAENIPPGAYFFDLGARRQGRLQVTQGEILEILEDLDALDRFGITFPEPTGVAGVVHGFPKDSFRLCRLRLVSLWGATHADSFVGPQGDFSFPGVPYGSYAILFLFKNRVVWSQHLDKTHKPIAALELRLGNEVVFEE